MNLKLTKERVFITFLNSVCWMPILFFCTQLLVSVRSKALFFEIRKASIIVFILLSALSWLVRKVILHLDKHDSYVKRIAKQGLYCFLIPLGVILMMMVVYDKYIDDSVIQSAFLLKELSLSAFLLYVFNCAYFSKTLEKRVSIIHEEQTKEKLFNEKFLVYRKGFYVPINLTEIAMVYQSAHLNWIVTFNDEKYVLNISLKEASDILGSQHFFAINRTHIIHREVVETIRSGDFGKIELTLKVQAIITTVSKGRASQFRRWFYRKSEHLRVRISK